MDYEEEYQRKKQRNKIIGISVLIIIALFVLVFVGWGWRWLSAPIEGAVGMRERTNDADYRLYSYDHFYNMYAEIQTFEDKIQNQQQYLKTVDIESDEAQRIRRNINALRNRRDAVIRQYNSDARKEESRGQFLADDLPYQVNSGDLS